MNITFDTYMEVSRLMNMQIGRNEYRIDQLSDESAEKRFLIKQNKEFEDLLGNLGHEYWGFDVSKKEQAV